MKLGLRRKFSVDNEAWAKAVSPELRGAYSDVIRAFTNWQPWILNYFEHPVTNAYTENAGNEEERNFGAHIPTLIELIEAGRI